MATAEKLTEHYLTCIICSEVYTNPATLRCGHTFCRQCLLKYTKTRPDAMQAKSIPCPNCRQMTRVTSPEKPIEDWVNQVKLSNLMQGLMDDFGPGAQTEDSSPCDACKHDGQRTKATSWCQECEESLCDNCVKLHQRFSSTRKHQVLPLTGGLSHIKRSRFMCKEHKEEQVKLFCQDCQKAICPMCSNIDHRQCASVVALESVMRDVKATLNRKRETLSKMIQEKTKNMAERKTRMEELVEQVKSTEMAINDTTQKVIAKIETKQSKLLGQLSKLKDDLTEKMTSEKKSEEIQIQTYQQQLEFLDQAIRSDSQQNMLTMLDTSVEYAERRTSEDPRNTLAYALMFGKQRSQRRVTGSVVFQQNPVLIQTVDELQLGHVVQRGCTIS